MKLSDVKCSCCGGASILLLVDGTDIKVCVVCDGVTRWPARKADQDG